MAREKTRTTKAQPRTAERKPKPAKNGQYESEPAVDPRPLHKRPKLGFQGKCILNPEGEATRGR